MLDLICVQIWPSMYPPRPGLGFSKRGEAGGGPSRAAQRFRQIPGRRSRGHLYEQVPLESEAVLKRMASSRQVTPSLLPASALGPVGLGGRLPTLMWPRGVWSSRDGGRDCANCSTELRPIAPRLRPGRFRPLKKRSRDKRKCLSLLDLRGSQARYVPFHIRAAFWRRLKSAA